MIPKILIQFWHDPSSLPEIISHAMEATKEQNRDYKYIFADDEFMYKFISARYQDSVLQLYRHNRIPASRADLARLMLLYEYGGFYVDASMELTGSLDQFNGSGTDLFIVLRDDAERHKANPKKANAINGFIGVKPKSDFIKWCIERVIRNLVTGENNQKVNISTGPNIINQALIEMSEMMCVKKVGMKELLNDFLIYRRVAGVSNKWTSIQRDGIINPDVYKSSGRRFEKLMTFKNFAFHFSFSLLPTKKFED